MNKETTKEMARLLRQAERASKWFCGLGVLVCFTAFAILFYMHCIEEKEPEVMLPFIPVIAIVAIWFLLVRYLIGIYVRSKGYEDEENADSDSQVYTPLFKDNV